MRKMIKEKKWKFILVFFICILEMLSLMKVQLLKGDVIDFAVAKNIDKTVNVFLWLFAMIIINKIFTYLYSLNSLYLCYELSYLLRKSFFKSLFSRRYSDLVKIDEGEIMAKYSKQLRTIEENLFFSSIPCFENVLILLFSIVTIFTMNPIIALISVALFMLPIFIPMLAKKRLEKTSEKGIKTFEAHLRAFNNYLESFEIIKNYCLEDKMKSRFSKSNSEVFNAEMKIVKTNAGVTGLSFLCSIIAQASIVILSAYLVFIGNISSGEFVSLLSLVLILNRPLYWIGTLFQNLLSTKPFVKSVLTFIENNDVKNSTENKINIDKNDFENICFDSLTFSYPNTEKIILENINLNLEKNKKYLILGESGSGKSTIMSLILNYFEPLSGGVKINQTNVKDISNLNNLVSITWQNAIIFEETLRNNLSLYDMKYSDEDFFAVLKRVGLSKLANENSLDMLIKEKGSNLSGGEKKRLSIARAFLRDTPVLILDEPLENIDKENVGLIENEILALENKMLIVISHQFTETKLKNFDAIYELGGGKLYEKVLD